MAKGFFKREKVNHRLLLVEPNVISTFAAVLNHDGESTQLVSHALGSIEKLCDEAIWLDKGRIEMWDEPHAVVEAYTDFLGVREEEEDPVTMEDV